jgi:hypothetical protein
MSDKTEQAEMWAIVELMGHVKLAGRMTEEEKFGAKMGRLDIPRTPDPNCKACGGWGHIDKSDVGEGQTAHPCGLCGGFVTQFFGGGSVYRITIVSEAVARHVAKGNAPAPVSPWDFPKALPETTSYVGEPTRRHDEFDDSGDEDRSDF